MNLIVLCALFLRKIHSPDVNTAADSAITLTDHTIAQYMGTARTTESGFVHMMIPHDQ